MAENEALRVDDCSARCLKRMTCGFLFFIEEELQEGTVCVSGGGAGTVAWKTGSFWDTQEGPGTPKRAGGIQYTTLIKF